MKPALKPAPAPKTDVIVGLRVPPGLWKKVRATNERRSARLYAIRKGKPLRRERVSDTLRWLLELGLAHEDERQEQQWGRR